MAMRPPEHVLDQQVRRRVFAYVQAYPGMHLREVARAMELDPNHAKYHLAYLARHGLVSSRREAGYWRFWPRAQGTLGWREEVPNEHKTHLAALRRRVPLHATLLLLARDIMNHAELQAEIRIAPSTVLHHMRTLEVCAVVASQRLGRERLYRLVDAPTTRSLLQRYQPPESLLAGLEPAWQAALQENVAVTSAEPFQARA